MIQLLLTLTILHGKYYHTSRLGPRQGFHNTLDRENTVIGVNTLLTGTSSLYPKIRLDTRLSGPEGEDDR